MIEAGTYYTFLMTVIFMCVSPGPDTILVLSRTVASGTGAGLATSLGTQTGNLVHALLAGVGVSTLFLLLPHALTILKYLGATYLVYLAVASWRAPATLQLGTQMASYAHQPYRYFLQGLTNNLVNPKMVPFFIALFPQFVDPNHPLVLQSLILGGTLSAIGLLWLSALTVLVGRFRQNVAGHPAFIKWSHRLAAITFVGLAARLAFESEH